MLALLALGFDHRHPINVTVTRRPI